MKTILYLSRTANKESIGIINKVSNTVKALNELGYSANATIFHERALKGSMKVAMALLRAKEDLIILRSDHYTMFIMLLPMLFARIRGKKVIVDIATPVCVAASEIEGSTSNALFKKIKKLVLYITFPISLYPANRVLEYSYESKWFSFGLKNKLMLVGNGALVKSIPFRAIKPSFDNKSLNLLGVAHLVFWHGYNRLIKSIHLYDAMECTSASKININFWIVGDGFEKECLMKLVKDLHLENKVHFLGVKEGDGLAECYKNAHVAVCSLALYKKKLSFASELKARDYAARGIPFILACDDYDFQEPLPFIYRCANDDSMIDLDGIVRWYANLEREYDDFTFIRSYAVEKLDYLSKVKQDILTIFKN